MLPSALPDLGQVPAVSQEAGSGGRSQTEQAQPSGMTVTMQASTGGGWGQPQVCPVLQEVMKPAKRRTSDGGRFTAFQMYPRPPVSPVFPRRVSAGQKQRGTNEPS